MNVVLRLVVGKFALNVFPRPPHNKASFLLCILNCSVHLHDLNSFSVHVLVGRLFVEHFDETVALPPVEIAVDYH